MPCALTTLIMSAEYAPEGITNQPHKDTFKCPATNDDISEEHHAKTSNSRLSNPLPLTISFSNTSVVDMNSESNQALNGMPTTAPKLNNHSFSIEALVGNAKSNETKKSDSDDVNDEPWSNSHLANLKQIQVYYQQLYNQTFSLKQLNNYLYPNLGIEADNKVRKLTEHSRNHDQLLTYYANLYIQNSSFYQERYLESLKAFSIDNKSFSHCTPNNFYETNDEDKCEELSSQESTLSTKTENDNTPSHLTPNSIHSSDQQSTVYLGEESFNCDGSNGSSGRPLVPLPSVTLSSSNPTSLMYSSRDKSINNQSASIRSNFTSNLLLESQPIVSSLNGSSFYPPYCDYDLLVKSKSNVLLQGSSPNGQCNRATPNTTTLHSPLSVATADSPIGPSPTDSNSSSAAAAAAAAYHLSTMFRKPKRIRTAFSPGQLLRLEEIFEKNRYVVGCERKQLARDLNLSETQIKVWFQNRRTKHKREKHVGGNNGSVGFSGSLGSGSYHSQHQEEKQSPSLRSFVSSSSGSSVSSCVTSLASSSISANYLSSSSNFTLPSSASGLYSSHFKTQNNVHRTLLAK